MLDYMEKERGIKRELLLDAVQTALLAAARKSFGPARDLSVALDPKTGKITAIAKLLVVEKATQPHDEISLAKARAINPEAQLGETVDVDVNTRELGRIAAQVFKQALNQTLRGHERTMIFDEFKGREGAIVTGTVRRFERSDVIVDLGKFGGRHARARARADGGVHPGRAHPRLHRRGGEHAARPGDYPLAQPPRIS
ncbi:MAG: NusA N-terminal domain-containing protein [Verrucomicrobiota bacterium]